MTSAPTSPAQMFTVMKAGNTARRLSFGLAERRAALDRLAEVVRRKPAWADAFEMRGNSPEEFAQYLRSEFTKWAKVIKDSGAQVD